jgi:hypothetical protein
MNDDLIPKWIKQIKDNDEAQKSEAELNRLRNLTAQAVVQSEGPRFWKQLAKDLEIAANACSKIGITATCNSLGNQAQPGEHGVRVDMNAGFPFHKIAHTILWYTEGSGYIRWITMEDQEKRIPLAIGPTGEISAVGASGGILGAEKTAEQVLAPLVHYVRS